MGTCRKCRHWKLGETRTGAYYYCGGIQEENDNHDYFNGEPFIGNHAVLFNEDQDCFAVLLTGPDFGCTLFEVREDAP